MDRISIVVPCFNEEEALPVYYREMKRVMGELSEVSFEILFVDDGSSDMSSGMHGLALCASRCARPCPLRNVCKTKPQIGRASCRERV